MSKIFTLLQIYEFLLQMNCLYYQQPTNNKLISYGHVYNLHNTISSLYIYAYF